MTLIWVVICKDRVRTLLASAENGTVPVCAHGMCKEHYVSEIQIVLEAQLRFQFQT